MQMNILNTIMAVIFLFQYC